MPLRQEGQAALRRAADALPHELARTNGDLRLDDIVGRSERIAERIEIHEQSVALVGLEHEPPERHGRHARQRHPAQYFQGDADPDEDGAQHRDQTERGAQVGLAHHQQERDPEQDERPDQRGARAHAPAGGQRPGQRDDEDQLEQLGRLHRERTQMDPAPGSRDRAAQHEDRGEQSDADDVQDGRGPHQVPVVHAGHHQEADQPHADPGSLAPHQRRDPAGRVQAPEGHEAQRDDEQGGAEERPVDVVQEAPVQAQHQPDSPIVTWATFWRK